MSDGFFIKAAAYCGYDKTEVDKRLEQLYENIHDLKNSLRETKLLLKNYEDGNDSAKAHDSVLAAERATLTQLQLKNRTLTEKCKAAREEAQQYEAENIRLREKLAKVEAELADAKLMIPTETSDSASILSSVFLEAQKSGTMIVDNAKMKADTIKEEAKKFAEEYINEVNFQAQKILYDAEKEAVDIRTSAMNESEQMRVASDNLHVVMLEDVEKIFKDLNKIKSVLLAFESSGLLQIEESSKMLYSIKETLSEGGVPVFRAPVSHEAEYPEAPQAPAKKKDNSEKQNLELARLQSMAENLENDSSEKKSQKNDNTTKTDTTPSNGVSLEALEKQLASLAGV